MFYKSLLNFFGDVGAHRAQSFNVQLKFISGFNGGIILELTGEMEEPLFQVPFLSSCLHNGFHHHGDLVGRSLEKLLPRNYFKYYGDHGIPILQVKHQGQVVVQVLQKGVGEKMAGGTVERCPAQLRLGDFGRGFIPKIHGGFQVDQADGVVFDRC